MEVDYIIVGSGLAGISFCEQLHSNNKTFIVFDDVSQKSSTVAGGMYNPVVLKRFTPVWKSKEQLKITKWFYRNLEKKLGVKLNYEIPVLRKFTSIEEQNNWFTAADNPELETFLSTSIIKNTNKSINAPFGYGEVLQTGRIDTKILVKVYKQYYSKIFLEETFNYNNLQISKSEVVYKGIKAKHIVFAEGFGLKQNPYFNYLPLKGTKGELLTINAPELNVNTIIKSNIFLIPLGKHFYRVGATYKWEDKTNTPTQKGKEELLNKLNTLVNCNFKITNHAAGIRPTVIDRRPLVGRHPKSTNLYLLNGLGTRGVMAAPYIAKKLYNFIENNTPLDKEFNITRFV